MSADFEFRDDAARPLRPCAFCRQDVGGAARTDCPKCAASYHADCWIANSSRCAIYGCVQVPRPDPPPPPVRRRPVLTVPASDGWRFGGGAWLLVLILLPNLIRLMATSREKSHPAPEVHVPAFPQNPRFSELPPTEELAASYMRQANSIFRSAEPFVAGLMAREELPQDPQERRPLDLQVAQTVNSLSLALQLYERCALREETDELRARREELGRTIGWLQAIRAELR